MNNIFPGLLRTYHLSNNEPLLLLKEMGRQDKVVLRRRGAQRLVSLTHPDHLKHVLITANDKYQKAPFLRNMWGPYFGEGLLSSSGYHWQKHRKVISPAFHIRMIEKYASEASRLSQRLRDDWSKKAKNGETIHLASDFATFALELVAHTVISGAMTREEIQQFAVDLNSVSSEIRLRDLAGIAHLFPQKPASKRRDAIAMVNTFAKKALERRRQSEDVVPDVLGLLLQAQTADDSDDFTDKDILDEVKTFFLAGFEVTSIVLSWSLYLLGQMDDQREKILSEIDQLPDAHSVTFDDLKNLGSLRRFIDEVMRLYPPGPIMSRQTIRDDEIDGIVIPKGCLVEMNVWQTHRHPDFWNDPEHFNPDRFLPENIRGRHKHAYLPFGSGPRTCIGKGMALMEIQLALATVLQKMTITPVTDQWPNFVSTFVMRPESSLPVKGILRENQAASKIRLANGL